MTFVLEKEKEKYYKYINDIKENIEDVPYYLINFDPFGDKELLEKIMNLKIYGTIFRKNID